MKIALLAILVALAGSGFARADEEKVPLKELPGAVVDAVKARFPKAEMSGAEKETEAGKTTYEIALKNEGKAIDLSIRADGTIQEIETVVAEADLPGPVAATLAARYPGATLKEAEEIVSLEEGKESKAFEVHLMTPSKKAVEVKLSPAGKVLKVEDGDED